MIKFKNQFKKIDHTKHTDQCTSKLNPNQISLNLKNNIVHTKTKTQNQITLKLKIRSHIKITIPVNLGIKIK